MKSQIVLIWKQIVQSFFYVEDKKTNIFLLETNCSLFFFFNIEDEKPNSSHLETNCSKAFLISKDCLSPMQTMNSICEYALQTGQAGTSPLELSLLLVKGFGRIEI